MVKRMGNRYHELTRLSRQIVQHSDYAAVRTRLREYLQALVEFPTFGQ